MDGETSGGEPESSRRGLLKSIGAGVAAGRVSGGEPSGMLDLSAGGGPESDSAPDLRGAVYTGEFGERPNAGVERRFYYATNGGTWYYDNGSSWNQINLGGTGAELVTTAGNVQTALDSLQDVENGRVKLSPDSDWSTATAQSDMPWVYQETDLDLNGQQVAVPSGTPAIITNPGFSRAVSNGNLQVPDDASITDSNGRVSGVIVLELDPDAGQAGYGLRPYDLSNLSNFRTIPFGAERGYSLCNVIDGVIVEGKEPVDQTGEGDTAGAAAVTLHERGQGYGLTNLNFGSVGMTHALDMFGEGADNPNAEDPNNRQGYMNGMGGEIFSHGDEVAFNFENTGANGVANSSWFEVDIQPEDATVRAFHLDATAAVNDYSISRPIRRVRWVGQVWDSQVFGATDSIMLCEGNNVRTNICFNNSGIGQETVGGDGTGVVPVTENGGAYNNGFLCQTDELVTALRKVEPFHNTGVIGGRDGALGISAQSFPQSGQRVGDGLYFEALGGAKENVAWGVQVDGSWRTGSFHQHTRNVSGTGTTETRGDGQDERIRVDTSGGAHTVNVASNDMGTESKTIVVADVTGNAATNNITITADDYNGFPGVFGAGGPNQLTIPDNYGAWTLKTHGVNNVIDRVSYYDGSTPSGA